MTEQDKLTLATERVQALSGFYHHLTIFVVVMTILLAVNVFASSVWWVEWPFLGWGLGILAHAWFVFGQPHSPVEDWKTRKINELKDKM